MSGPIDLRVAGFTGTRHGMTFEQKITFEELLSSFEEIHHGDCQGADYDAHQAARIHGQRIVVHPPADDRLRAFCGGRGVTTLPPKDYHSRNRDIVDACDALIATPAEMVEQDKGGTWYTIRYARSVGKQIGIVWPDGSTSFERAQ